MSQGRGEDGATQQGGSAAEAKQQRGGAGQFGSSNPATGTAAGVTAGGHARGVQRGIAAQGLGGGAVHSGVECEGCGVSPLVGVRCKRRGGGGDLCGRCYEGFRYPTHGIYKGSPDSFSKICEPVQGVNRGPGEGNGGMAPRWVIEVHFFKHRVSRRGKTGIDLSNKHRGFFGIGDKRGILYDFEGEIYEMVNMTQEVIWCTQYMERGEVVEMNTARVVLAESGGRIWEGEMKEDDVIGGSEGRGRGDGTGGDKGGGQGDGSSGGGTEAKGRKAGGEYRRETESGDKVSGSDTGTGQGCSGDRTAAALQLRGAVFV